MVQSRNVFRPGQGETHKPTFVRLFFALDRLKELAPKHPRWKIRQPFKAVLDNHFEALAAGEREMVKLVMASHAGMSAASYLHMTHNALFRTSSG